MPKFGYNVLRHNIGAFKFRLGGVVSQAVEVSVSGRGGGFDEKTLARRPLLSSVFEDE